MDVRVRVPNDVYRALTIQAAKVGQSLAEFLRDELAKVAVPVSKSRSTPVAGVGDLVD